MELLTELEKTRTLMIESGMELGFQNAKTIQLSKELDRLMNQFDLVKMSEPSFEYHQYQQKIYK